MDTTHYIHAYLVYLEAAYAIYPLSGSNLKDHDLRLRIIENHMRLQSPNPTIEPTIEDVTRRVTFLYGHYIGRYQWPVQSTIEFTSLGSWNMSSLSRAIKAIPWLQYPALESLAEEQAMFVMIELLAQGTWRIGCCLPQDLPKLVNREYLGAWLVALGTQRPKVEFHHAPTPLPGVMMREVQPTCEETEPAVTSRTASRSSHVGSVAIGPSSQGEYTTENTPPLTPCTEFLDLDEEMVSRRPSPQASYSSSPAPMASMNGARIGI